MKGMQNISPMENLGVLVTHGHGSKIGSIFEEEVMCFVILGAGSHNS